MDFNEKLVTLRKQKGWTQEELAKELYVSRTAVSKWESGRGFPGIESLRAIAKLFSISIDELLSGEELITAAKSEAKEKSAAIIFGLFDCMVGLLMFLPFFGQKSGEQILSVSLINLTAVSHYIKTAYIGFIAFSVIFGILQLALQNSENGFFRKNKFIVSLALSVAGLFIFIISTQPYAGAFLLFMLIIKLFSALKMR